MPPENDNPDPGQQDNGQGGGDWRQIFSPEFHGTLAKFRTPDDLVKSYHSYDSEIKSRVKIPDKDAPEHEKAQYRRRMGIPDSPDDYAIPDADERLKGAFDAVRKIAHDEGVPKNSFENMVREFQRQLDEQAGQVKQTEEEQRGKLIEAAREQFGDTFDEVKANAERFINKIVEDEEQSQFLKSSGVLDHPLVMSLLHEAARAVGPHNIPGSLGGGKDVQIQTAKSLRDRFQEIQKSEAYNAKTQNTEKKKLQQEVIDITRQLVDLGYTGINDPKIDA